MLHYHNYIDTFIFTDSTKKIDVVFVLDSSGSIQHENFHYLLEFTSEIIRGLNIGSDYTRASVVTFSNNAQVEIFLDDYNNKYDIMHAIQMIRYQGFSTYTEAAFHMIEGQVFKTERGDRQDVINYIVLITDGEPVNRQETFEAALGSRMQGNNIMVVGIDMNQHLSLIYEAIATDPQHKTVIGVKSIKQLSTITTQVTQTLIDSKLALEMS